MTETKSDDLRKFVAEKKETRRFDNMVRVRLRP